MDDKFRRRIFGIFYDLDKFYAKTESTPNEYWDDVRRARKIIKNICDDIIKRDRENGGAL